MKRTCVASGNMSGLAGAGFLSSISCDRLTTGTKRVTRCDRKNEGSEPAKLDAYEAIASTNFSMLAKTGAKD